MRMVARALLLAILATALLVQLSFSYVGGPTAEVGAGTLEVGINQTAPLVVEVGGIANLQSFEMHLSFDPSLVEVVDADPVAPGVQVTPGDFLTVGRVTQNDADNEAGTIDFALSQISPSPPKTGSGTLFTVELRGLANGQTPIHNVRSRFATIGNRVIDVTVADGTAKVSPAVVPFAAETVVPAGTPQDGGDAQPKVVVEGTPGVEVTATVTVTSTAAPAVATAELTLTPTATLTVTVGATATSGATATPGAAVDPDAGQGGGISPLVIAAAIVALGVLGYEGWRMWIARTPAHPR